MKYMVLILCLVGCDTHIHIERTVSEEKIQRLTIKESGLAVGNSIFLIKDSELIVS